MKLNRKFALGTLVMGLVTLSYLAKMLYDRGIYADVSGTSGYITNLEILFIIMGFVLLVAGLGMLMMRNNAAQVTLRSKEFPYVSAGLCFMAGCISLATPTPILLKLVAALLFFIAAASNVVAARKASRQ